jgi:hypothetical protein
MLSYENITVTGCIFYHRKPLIVMGSVCGKGVTDIALSLMDGHFHDFKQRAIGSIRWRHGIEEGRNPIGCVVRQPIFWANEGTRSVTRKKPIKGIIARKGRPPAREAPGKP